MSSKKITSSQKGKLAEKLAIDYLLAKGFELLACNYYTRHGEIDIIVQNKEFTVFVEVKYRKSKTFYHPRETVNSPKIKKILASSNDYIQKNNLNDHNFRFDIIEISGSDFILEHLENAFY